MNLLASEPDLNGNLDEHKEELSEDEEELRGSLLNLRFEKMQIDAMVNSMIATGRLEETEGKELKEEMGVIPKTPTDGPKRGIASEE